MNFAGLLLVLAALHAILDRPYWVTFGVAVLAVPALASYSRIPLMPPRLRFPWILAVTLLLGGLMIRAEPEPYIDLWYMQQRACGLLLLGENPYAALYPNIYPDEGHYGAAVLRGHSILSFCYPPLSILLALPGYCLAGDVRWSLLAATGGAATFLVAAGRRLGLPAGHWAELGVALLLLHPMTPVVVLAGGQSRSWHWGSRSAGGRWPPDGARPWACRWPGSSQSSSTASSGSLRSGVPGGSIGGMRCSAPLPLPPSSCRSRWRTRHCSGLGM